MDERDGLETSDIGRLIKDGLTQGSKGAGRPARGGRSAQVVVEHVDDADPNNLRVLASNGQWFTVRVVAGAR